MTATKLTLQEAEDLLAMNPLRAWDDELILAAYQDLPLVPLQVDASRELARRIRQGRWTMGDAR